MDFNSDSKPQKHESGFGFEKKSDGFESGFEFYKLQDKSFVGSSQTHLISCDAKLKSSNGFIVCPLFAKLRALIIEHHGMTTTIRYGIFWRQTGAGSGEQPFRELVACISKEFGARSYSSKPIESTVT